MPAFRVTATVETFPGCATLPRFGLTSLRPRTPMLWPISPTFLSYVPFFAMLFIVAYVAWMAYMLPVKRKFASGAIYH